MSPADQRLVAPEPAAVALAFLRRLYPSGPWLLTAIIPDGPIETVRFGPETADACRAWIADRDGRANLYYSPNEPLPGVTKKAAKVDIARVHVLHADLDARPGEATAAAIARTRRSLTEALPEGVPPPTAVVFSGGGHQALWRLREPVPIEGDLARAEDVERYNIALGALLDADHAHDISRVLRLPGTLNLPNRSKRAKGREPVRSELVAFHAERVYDLAAFPAAPPTRGAAGSGPPTLLAAPTIAAPCRLGSVEELPPGVSDLCRAAIVSGREADPDRWPSRSEALFFVCCELVRAGVDDATVLGVITDPDFGISASVLAAKKSEAYALRQLARAKECVAADDGDAVAWVNQRYFAALEGARVAFYREEADGTVEAMQASAFEFELAPKVAEFTTEDGKSHSVPYSKLWRTSPRRRYYPRGFVLDAGEGHDPLAYNLWKGFGVEPRPGGWARMRAHIEEVLAAGDASHADYIVRWTAWSLQNPATPPRVALVFKGEEGVGKGLYANALVRAFGVHGMRVQNMLHLAGRFNAHLRHCCLLFADEAVVPGSDLEGSLKGMITEPTIPIERKGVDVVQAENHLHVVMASNRDWVVPAGIGARRFAVFAVSDHRKGDRDYFSTLVAETEAGGLAAMVHDLLALDLGRWHPEGARPETRELARQKVHSLAPIARVWFDCLVTGLLPPGAAARDLWGFVPTRAFREQVATETRSSAVTLNEISAFFDAMGFEKRREKNGAGRGYEIPPLAEARRRWDEQRFAVQWDETIAQWASGEGATELAGDDVPF